MAIRPAIIFDLDGVLTDTAELHFQAWKRLADERGIPFDRQHNQSLRGVGREESLRRLLAGRPVSPSKFAAMLERKNDYYLAMIAKLTPDDLAPGAAELLANLRRLRWKIGLASGSRNAQRVVDRLRIREWFSGIADGASVERGKPAPDLFLHCAGLIGASPSACVVVEDAPAGLQAARAAGMHTVSVGPDTVSEMADLHVADVSELHAAELAAILGRSDYGAARPTVASSSFGPF